MFQPFVRSTHSVAPPLSVDTTPTGPVTVAPTFSVSPSSRSVTDGTSTTFSATINAGSGPITVKWQRNGTDIAGSTSTVNTTPATVTRTVAATTADNGATYRCVATNTAGSATSSAGTLTVTASTEFPFPEAGEPQSALFRADRSWGSSKGWFQGTGWLPGTALSRVSDVNGIRYSDNTLFWGRVAYPPNPAIDAAQFTFRAADSRNIENGTDTERSQLQWSEGMDGVTLSSLQALNTEHWVGFRFSFDVTNPWPSEVLVFQNHATKNNLSWGGASPPWAIYMSNNNGSARMWFRHIGYTNMAARGVISRGGRWADFPTAFNNQYTLVDNTQPNTDYEIILNYRLAGNNTGWLKVWVNGVLKVDIVDLQTTFPCDSLELNADGSYKAGFGPFITLSHYAYRQGGGDYIRRMFFPCFFYRRHFTGMTRQVISTKMASIGKF